MKNWINNLSRFQYSLICGAYGALGGLIAIVISELMNDTMTPWVILGGFVGGFVSSLIVDYRKKG